MLSIKVSNAQDRTSRPASAFGTLATLVTAVLIAYVFPTDEKEKAGSARAPGLEPRRDDRDASAPRALEPDRGRLATAPSEIPARGWKDILLRVYHNISDHRVVALAAGMTFYSLLAIFRHSPRLSRFTGCSQIRQRSRHTLINSQVFYRPAPSTLRVTSSRALQRRAVRHLALRSRSASEFRYGVPMLP